MWYKVLMIFLRGQRAKRKTKPSAGTSNPGRSKCAKHCALVWCSSSDQWLQWPLLLLPIDDRWWWSLPPIFQPSKSAAEHWTGYCFHHSHSHRLNPFPDHHRSLCISISSSPRLNIPQQILPSRHHVSPNSPNPLADGEKNYRQHHWAHCWCLLRWQGFIRSRGHLRSSALDHRWNCCRLGGGLLRRGQAPPKHPQGAQGSSSVW